MHALDLDGMLRRLHLPTVRRLYPECELRAEAEDQSYRDFLATLIAEEVAHRAQTRIERSVRKARFPFLRSIEDFDFTFQTSIRLQLLGSYLGPELVSEGRSLILCGPTGTGKTHLAIAIAYRAIQNGYEALFTSAAEMIETLSVAVRRGEMAKTLAHYTHPSVLVIDEVGYLAVGGDAANLMFQVVNERYLHRRPMLFTTNKPLAAWGLVLHDPDLAEAILDRVLERGRLVELRGASYRTRHLKVVDRSSSSSEVVRISGNQRSDFPEPTALERSNAGAVEPAPALDGTHGRRRHPGASPAALSGLQRPCRARVVLAIHPQQHAVASLAGRHGIRRRHVDASIRELLDMAMDCAETVCALDEEPLLGSAQAPAVLAGHAPDRSHRTRHHVELRLAALDREARVGEQVHPLCPEFPQHFRSLSGPVRHRDVTVVDLANCHRGPPVVEWMPPAGGCEHRTLVRISEPARCGAVRSYGRPPATGRSRRPRRERPTPRPIPQGGGPHRAGRRAAGPSTSMAR
jgi:DNA replication protein DnaC